MSCISTQTCRRLEQRAAAKVTHADVLTKVEGGERTVRVERRTQLLAGGDGWVGGERCGEGRR